MSAENEHLVRTFLAGTNTLDEYLAFFADDCIYRVANQSNVIGKEALAQAAGRFRSSVERVEHRILQLWVMSDRVTCELEAIYTRKDGKTVSLPCLDIFTIESGKIRGLQIFADLSPVFKP
jgi:ketosteroid isomerase-like protein